MKRMTRCYECKKLIKFHGSMVAKIMEKVKKYAPNGQEIEVEEEKVVKLCRSCVADAGYKVSSEREI